MKILGIDPGTTRIGYGLVEKSKGIRLLECGLISGEGVPQEKRLLVLDKKLAQLIKKASPDLICVEKLFFARNKKTAISVAEARGVVMLNAQKADIRTLEFTPSEIKSVVAGDGQTSKKGVERAVCLTLKLDSIPGPDDVSDAVAIALRGSFERVF